MTTYMDEFERVDFEIKRLWKAVFSTTIILGFLVGILLAKAFL